VFPQEFGHGLRDLFFVDRPAHGSTRVAHEVRRLAGHGVERAPGICSYFGALCRASVARAGRDDTWPSNFWEVPRECTAIFSSTSFRRRWSLQREFARRAPRSGQHAAGGRRL
jgi:hypothetical protein